MNVEDVNRAVQSIVIRQKGKEGAAREADFQDIVSQIISMMNVPLGEPARQGEACTESQPEIDLNQIQLHSQGLGSIAGAKNEAVELPLYGLEMDNSYRMESEAQAEITINYEQPSQEEFNLTESISEQGVHGADLEHEVGLVEAGYSENRRIHPQGNHNPSLTALSMDTPGKKDIPTIFEAELAANDATDVTEANNHALLATNRWHVESSQHTEAWAAEETGQMETDTITGNMQRKVSQTEQNVDKPPTESADKSLPGGIKTNQTAPNEEMQKLSATDSNEMKADNAASTAYEEELKPQDAQKSSKPAINSTGKSLDQRDDLPRRDVTGLEQRGDIPGLQNQTLLSESRIDSESPTPQPALIENMQDIEIKLAEEFTLLESQDESSLKMRLKPEQLGEMEVRLRMKDGYLSAEILVETISAREAMESQLQNLRQRLREQNILLNEVNIGLHESNQELNQGRRNSFNHGDNHYQQYSGQTSRGDEADRGKSYPQALAGSYHTGITGNSLDLLA